MSRRAVLWIGFALVHVVVAVLGFRLPNQPMGDVYLVYEPWALQALSGGGIPGVTEQWIYPPVALVPMVLAVGLEWIAGYEVAWALLVTACDALAFALLVGHARSRGRSVGAWFWLAFILLLGPVGMYRLDGLTVPLAIAGCLWLVGRPAVASALLTIATWIKVWPAALLAAAVIAVRRRLSIITTALVASAAILLVVVLAGGAEHALGFVSGQTDRGLQLEAPVSMFYLWQAVAGVEGSYLYYDRNILTFQVTGPQVDGVIAVMTPLLMVALVAVAALGAVQLRRGARFAGLFPALALSLVLVFIVFNKVGSPQYLTWIIAPIVLGLVLDRNRWSPLAIGALVTAALTQIVYPITYNFLLNADVLAVAVLTARNLLLVALLVWTLIHVVRAPVHARAHAAATDTTP
ncbi:glycosyltransferase 87 family protein [Microbacterium sp. SLBN-146]|uniref:glycosyltransferase 87 family protein n=1 Tax=Microbacterium sp. SLBN-146 TaxID=2768457 RepID=UPI00114F23A2|nr:glycosyltransferase 87 family protein [Microbacterium sp. SLBN-146]